MPAEYQPPPLDRDAPSVQSHLTMLQGIVSRLASNSAACKTWCVTLVSALAVVVAQSGPPKLLMIAALPIVIFCALDCYYLGLERRFRECYDGFVRKLHTGTARIEDAFVVAPKLALRGAFIEAIQAALSFSVWPFYVGLAVLLLLLGRVLASASVV